MRRVYVTNRLWTRGSGRETGEEGERRREREGKEERGRKIYNKT